MHGALEPDGGAVWWFDDRRGDEFGCWMRQPFAGGAASPAAPALPTAYSAGLALGRTGSVIGSAGDAGSSVYLLESGRQPRLLYRHQELAEVAGLSRDETLVALSHSEHGDSRHPALRILDRRGDTLAERWDGPGRGLWALDWSPLAGD